MSEALIIAILTAVGKVGFTGVITFLENRGATIDSAIEALRLARDKTLEAYIAENAESRLRALGVPVPGSPKPDGA